MAAVKVKAKGNNIVDLCKKTECVKIVLVFMSIILYNDLM